MRMIFEIGDFIKGTMRSNEEYGDAFGIGLKQAVVVDSFSYSNPLDYENDIDVTILEHENSFYIGETRQLNSLSFDLYTKPNIEQSEKEIVESDSNQIVGLVKEYDEQRQVGFIRVGDKYTICIPMTKKQFGGLGIAITDEEYETPEIGKAIAFYKLLGTYELNKK